MLEQLHDIYGDNGKYKLVPLVNVSYTDATVVDEDRGEDKQIQLLLITQELINTQSNDTYCFTVFNKWQEGAFRKVSHKSGWTLAKVVRDDDKLFHALVVWNGFWK